MNVNGEPCAPRGARTVREGVGIPGLPHDINLMSYIHKVRVEKAKKLLLESSLSIQKVAELVGYRHEKHFMQIFKKACGMTPSQFRFRKKE